MDKERCFRCGIFFVLLEDHHSFNLEGKKGHYSSLDCIASLRAEVESEKAHSKFLEKLLEAIVGPGWNKLTIYDAEKMQIAGEEG